LVVCVVAAAVLPLDVVVAPVLPLDVVVAPVLPFDVVDDDKGALLTVVVALRVAVDTGDAACVVVSVLPPGSDVVVGQSAAVWLHTHLPPFCMQFGEWTKSKQLPAASPPVS